MTDEDLLAVIDEWRERTFKISEEIYELGFMRGFKHGCLWGAVAGLALASLVIWMRT